RGEIVTRAGDTPPLTASRFRASIFWMGKEPLRFHKKYKLKLATQEVEAELAAITKIIDAAELTSREEAEEVRINDVAEVILQTKDEIAFDLFRDCQATGRFVIVDGYDVAGGGIVISAEEEEGFNEKTMRYIMEHLPYNGELTVVVKNGKVDRLERIEKEIFSGIDGEGI
ncbi:MAG: sulfate adenylyltransferase, partial [Selenomonadaceae bacterium]|nr:sulfate adenylyltransferase [Selenomonadaceae bacterium]